MRNKISRQKIQFGLTNEKLNLGSPDSECAFCKAEMCTTRKGRTIMDTDTTRTYVDTIPPQIVNAIYSDLSAIVVDSQYLRDRAILTPLNEDVDSINSFVLNNLRGKSYILQFRHHL